LDETLWQYRVIETGFSGSAASLMTLWKFTICTCVLTAFGLVLVVQIFKTRKFNKHIYRKILQHLSTQTNKLLTLPNA